MKMPPIHRALETAANCAAVVLAAVVLIQFILPRHAEPSPAVTRRAPNGPRKGMIIPAAKSIADREHILIAVLSSRCHYCARSLPLLTEVVSAAHNSPSSKVIAIFPPNDSHAEEFLREAHVDVPIERRLSFDDLGIHATPTFVLLDRDARVVSTWIGELSKTTAAEFKNAVR